MAAARGAQRREAEEKLVSRQTMLRRFLPVELPDELPEDQVRGDAAVVEEAGEEEVLEGVGGEPGGLADLRRHEGDPLAVPGVLDADEIEGVRQRDRDLRPVEGESLSGETRGV